jgi:hypothetical protein
VAVVILGIIRPGEVICVTLLRFGQANNEKAPAWLTPAAESVCGTKGMSNGAVGHHLQARMRLATKA